MASLSDFAEQSLINHLLRNTSFTSPATVYLALYSSNPTDADTGTEVSGGGYARQAMTFGAPTDGVATNSVQVTFPEATAAWGTVSHVGIRTALTGGSLLFHAPMATPKTIAQGDQQIFKVGTVSASLS